MVVERIVLLTMMVCLYASNSKADVSTIKRVLSEYPSEAQFLSERFDRCSGSFRHELAGKNQPNHADIVFFRSHGFDKFEVQIEIEHGNQIVKVLDIYCVDARSAFEIGRTGDQEGYRLIKRRMKEIEREIFEIEYARIPRAPLGGYQKSLIDMLNAGTVKLINANVSTSDLGIVETTFDVDDGSPLKQIKASFDTRNHWAIIHESMYIGSPLKLATEYEVEYGDRIVDGVRLPVRFTDKIKKQHRNFLKWEFGELPRESFLLPYYGLPDLINTGKSRIGRFEIIFATIAAAAVILGVALQRFSNRGIRAESLESRK